MQLPINVIHFYIAIPVLTYLAIDSLIRYKKNNNQVTFYLGLALLYESLAVICLGIPILLSKNLDLFNFGTYAGDIFQAASFLMLWFISIKAFLAHKPLLLNIANIGAVSLFVAIVIDAIVRNLDKPYKNEILQRSTNTISIVYNNTLYYQILNGIDSLVLIFIAVYFWKQANKSPTNSSTIKIKTVSIGFIFAALAFTVTPALPLNIQPFISAVLLTHSLLAFTIGFVLAGFKKD